MFVLTIPNIVGNLKKLEKSHPGGILSIYLNTDRSTSKHASSDWKTYLKSGLKQLSETYENQQKNDSSRHLERLCDKVEEALLQLQPKFQKGIIVFASHDGEILETLILQTAVKNEFFWREHVVLDQLQDIRRAFPPVGILLTQKNQLRLIDMELSIIREEWSYEWDIETDDWRRYKGLGAGYIAEKSSSSQVDQFKERVETHTQKEYERLLPILKKEAANRKWDGVYLIGDKQLVEHLKPVFTHLNFVHVIEKNYHTKQAQQILNDINYFSG